MNNSIHIDTYGHDNELVLGYALRISPAKEVNTLLLYVVFGFTPINVGLEFFVIYVTGVIMMGGFIETRREKYQAALLIRQSWHEMRVFHFYVFETKVC
jgi:hypothetical protein